MALDLLPTEPGALTPNRMDNARALWRAQHAYNAQYCDYRSAVYETSNGICLGGATYYKARRNAPAFENFFNENKDKWYSKVPA